MKCIGINRILFFLLFLVFVAEAKSATALDAKENKSNFIIKKEATISQRTDINRDYNIELLKEQNKALSSFNEKITSTVLWALSFAALFLILFLGVNVYFFRNRYNEEKEYLLQFIENNIKEKSTALDNTHKSLISKLENNFEERATLVEDKAADVTKRIITPLEEKIGTIEERLGAHKINLLELEIEEEIRKGVKKLILHNYFFIVQEANKLKKNEWDWKISKCLEQMEILLNKGVNFDAYILPEVTELINSLPSQFNDATHKFREAIRNSKT